MIIDKIDKRTTYSIISKIRNDFCNGQTNIDIEKFKFFEPWFRTQGKLEARADDVIDKILKPVFNHRECWKLVLEQKEYYCSLIISAGDAANEFKQVLVSVVNETGDTALKLFAISLGISFESSEE
jgi:hypothetical protein